MRKERTPIIAANWKMHNGPQQACSYIQALLSALPQAKRCGIVLCLPYVDLAAAAPLLRDTRMALGAQNLHWAPQGAYTGEISASMLTQLEVRYVIVGHSERRRLFGESDQDVNQKLRAALDAGLRPILCVGEDLEQRQLGAAMELSRSSQPRRRNRRRLRWSRPLLPAETGPGPRRWCPQRNWGTQRPPWDRSRTRCPRPGWLR